MLYHESDSEVSLRRAISACYYAVFHSITTAGAELFSGPDPLRNQISRSYDHTALMDAARRVERRSDVSSSASAEAEMIILARAVIRLQEQRHRADYDLTTTMTWDEADEAFVEAGKALNAVQKLKGQAALAEFLLSPLLQ